MPSPVVALNQAVAIGIRTGGRASGGGIALAA
jgi:predicted RNA polymerase sigma factor